MKNDILILGDGFLGSTIHSMTNWDYISRKKNGLDFTNIDSYKQLLENYSAVVNCIAHTDTYSLDKQKHWNINYSAVCDLVDFCNLMNKKLIHISTDYVYCYSKENADEDNDVPVHARNWYSYTKLLADSYIELRCKNYLILRGSFKKFPCTWKYATNKQIGNFDYINIISDLMIKLIKKDASGIFNVGTEVKSIYELMKQSNNDIELYTDKINESMPENTTMNIEKMNKFIKEN